MSNVILFPSKKSYANPEIAENKQRLKDWLAAYIHQSRNEDCPVEILSDKIVECLSENWLNLK